MPEFAWPWMFLLLPLPLLVRLLPARDRREAALRVPDLQGFEALDAGGLRRTERTGARLILLWLIWLALISAAARPSGPAQGTMLKMPAPSASSSNIR